MNNKTFAIGVLSVTSVVLLAALVVVYALTPRPAFAAGQSDAAGDYVVTTGRLDDGTELLYVLHTRANQMNVYGLNTTLNQIELIQPFDIKPLLRAAPEKPEG